MPWNPHSRGTCAHEQVESATLAAAPGGGQVNVENEWLTVEEACAERKNRLPDLLQAPISAVIDVIAKARDSCHQSFAFQQAQRLAARGPCVSVLLAEASDRGCPASDYYCL